MASIRLNKFLATRLGISRRAADAAIAAGQVTVDGEPAQLGARLEFPTPSDEKFSASNNKVSRPGDKERPMLNTEKFSMVGDTNAANRPHSTPETDVKNTTNLDFSQIPLDKLPKVCYNGLPIGWSYDRLCYLLNKPVGYVCSRRRQGKFPTVYELLPPHLQNLKAVGRLDRDSSGLLLFTNDGDFAQRMTHPRYAKTKIYEVELDRPLAPLHQQMIADFGVLLPDGPSQLGLAPLDRAEPRSDQSGQHNPNQLDPAPATSQPEGSSPVRDRRAWQITMHEGRNRQIRRTFAALGYTVTRLHRVQFGPYTLGDLQPGAYRAVKI